MYIKRNDVVMVISGKDKGKTGKVIEVITKDDKVVVEGVNMVSKALRPKSREEKGGIVKKEAPLHVSNVALIANDGKPTRVGHKMDGDKKVRYSKRTGEIL